MPQLKGYIRSIAMIVLLSAITACGPKLPPNTSAEGSTAVRGTQVVAALRAAIPGIKALVCQPGAPETAVPNCLQAKDADEVFALMEKSGGIAEQLAQALAAVDVAKTLAERQDGMARVGQFVRSLQQTLTMIQVAPENEAARNSIVQLLANVTSLLFAIGGL